MPGRGKFSEGSARAKAVASSVVPVASSVSGVMMSMGDCDSATVRSATWVPVTISVSRVRASLLAGAEACCANTGPAISNEDSARARGVMRGMFNSNGG